MARRDSPGDRKPAETGLLAAARLLRERDIEPMSVYRPATPAQLSIHTSDAHELIVRGGKRSSKSTCGFIEFAARVTGRNVMANLERPAWYPTPADVPLKPKFPVARKNDPKLYWIIGWDLKHIGQTVFRLLFEPGLFRVIEDQDTGMWRAWNPAHPGDAARKADSVATAPLIPDYLIDENSWSWDNAAGGKSGKVFREVRLKNGAKICTYPSSAKGPKMGDPVDGLLIDEDIQQPVFLDEYQDRLTDHDGWFMWTVWPQVSNRALVDIIKRAEAAKNEENASIKGVQLLMSENPFVTEEARERALDRMGDPESIARRDRGELLIDALAMYDYAPAMHGLFREGEDLWGEQTIPGTKKHFLQDIFRQQGKLPDNWTRYVSIDPSHTRTAVAVFCVPPPEFEGFKFDRCVILEEELVVTRVTARVLAEALHDLLGSRKVEAFIMDQQMGKQTRVGSDMNVFQTYAEEFKRSGLESRLTKHTFFPGCNKPRERYESVRDLMSGTQGFPDLFIIPSKCPKTINEFDSYEKKQNMEGGLYTITDEPANPRKHDCMAALEYGCAYLVPAFKNNMAYVEPEQYVSRRSDGVLAFAKALIAAEQQDRDFMHMGAGQGAY